MKESVILQRGNKLEIKFDITHPLTEKNVHLTSSKYQCGAVYFQLEAISSTPTLNNSNSNRWDFQVVVFVRFLKLFKNDILTYTCKFSSGEIEQLKMSEDNTWYKTFVHTQSNVERNTFNYSFNVSFLSDLATKDGPFVSFYENTNTTDFKLCGDGGSVKVHKFALQIYSPVLRNMLNGEWKETSEGQITIADTNKETLEHFKDYIYLEKLPSAGIEQLLLLGSYFMMPDLVQKCIVKLLNNLTCDNVLDMIEFAVKFKVTNLLVALLHIIRQGGVSIDHISEDDVLDMCQHTNYILNK